MTSNGRGVKRLSGWAGCETLCSASQLPSQTCTTKHISSTHPSFWACLWHWKRRFWKGGVSQSCLGGQTQSVWKNDVMKLDGIVVLLHFRTVGLFWKGGFGTRGAQESWRKVGWNLSQIYWLNITVRSTRILCAMVHGCRRSINETSHMCFQQASVTGVEQDSEIKYTDLRDKIMNIASQRVSMITPTPMDIDAVNQQGGDEWGDHSIWN